MADPQGDGVVVESSKMQCALGKVRSKKGVALPNSQCPVLSLTQIIQGWHQGGHLDLESGGCCLLGFMWKIRKQGKSCSFGKGIKLQRKAQAPGTAGFIAGLHRYL